MRLAAHCGSLVFVVGSFFQPTIARAAQSLPDCSAVVSPEEIRKNDWISFHDGRVLRIDLKGGLLAVDFEGKHYGIYFNGNTEICHGSQPGSLRDLKVGDTIGGFTKIIKGRSVAVILGFGSNSYPSGIPVPGREGWVLSPYAPAKAPLNVAHVPPGALVTCPYTGKLFRNPARLKS